MTHAWLSVIGIGEDGMEGLSSAAKDALAQATFVYGGARHLALIGPHHGQCLAWPSPIEQAYEQILARRGQNVAVLASGDPFFYGIGSVLAKMVPEGEMASYPHVSSLSLAAAKLGWALQDCGIVSLHGRALERIIPLLQPGARILALSWDGSTPEAVARLLCARGMAASRLTVLERLGGPAEKIHRAQAQDLAEAHMPQGGFDALNVVAIEIQAQESSRILPLARGLPDAWFEHDGQITKRDIRAVTLAALAPRQGEILWDIGAGSGSISIEWMLCSPSQRAFAIEHHSGRAQNIRRNARALGVPDLVLVEAAAPQAFSGLPAPDAIFIGGGATRDGMVAQAWEALKPGGRMVINAVTLETQAQLTALFQRHGGRLTQISLAEADPVGRFHGWRAAMPVVQWQARK